MRCSLLYDLWQHYEHDAMFDSGERARAELALYRCQQGDFRGNIVVLEEILKRGRFAPSEFPGANPVQPDNAGQRQDGRAP